MKKIIVFALAMVLALSLTACGGGSSNNGGGSTTTPPANSGTTPPASQGGNDTTPSNNGGSSDTTLFDIPQDKFMVSSSLDKAAVLGEIPAEIFKGVGELNSVDVWADSVSDFKYVVVLKFNVKSGTDAVKTLMDYYKSVSGTVEETGNQYNPYSVKFDWGESTEVKVGSDYVDLQFSVVK